MKTINPLVLSFFFLCLFLSQSLAQITTDQNAPYSSPVYLVDSILLGEGVVASNHSFQGDPLQIGYFNGVNSNIGLDSGIIMGTGNISEIVPGFFGGGILINNLDDPDLVEVASSVPDLIGQNFEVNAVQDVAILEFDFVPVSSYLSFKYVFSSEEYFQWENSQFNDVFGFFISGPGIVGPYSSPAGFPDGSINIATFESLEENSLGVDLPITISSVNAEYNPNYFVSNQNNGNNTVNPTLDGFTTVITAEANVTCGATYHIRLAIADGTDSGLSSFVLLEAGSFSSPPINVLNSLNVDSSQIFTNCGDPVTLTANVQSAGFEFLWNTGETTQSIEATPGYYWVQASDSTGCSVQSDSLLVYSQPYPQIEMPEEFYYCANSSYLIDPVINSGTAPFTYNWGGFGNNLQLEVSQPGTYNLSVIDSNGCSDSKDIIIYEKPIPNLSYSPQEILICGEIPVEVTASGANSYEWTPNIGVSSDTGSVIEIFSSSSITYTLEGTDTAGCSNSILIPVTATNDFDLNIATFAENCQGYSDGSITILPPNAVSPIQYSIDGGANYYNYFTFDDLNVGSYDIKVKDGLGCVISDTVIVQASEPEIQVLTSSSYSPCSIENSGIISVDEISGGNVSSGYSYTWFSSGTDDVVGTDSVLNVSSGGYYLVVEDDNGCQATDEVYVDEPNPLTYSYTKSDVSCHGGNDGQISVTINGGGTPPYSLDWVNYGNLSTPYLYNLVADTYELEIRDSNNCVSLISIEVEESLTPLTLEIQNINVSCFGEESGSAKAIANGGTPPYFYQWSSGHISDVASYLTSGNYTVSVTDASGCTLSKTVEILENPEIVSTLSSTPASCFGYLDGIASVSSQGGTGLLFHTWSTDDTSTAITSGFGEYWVKVEDELGCISLDTVMINQPEKLRIELTTNDVSCFGGFDGSIESDVTGGTPFNNQTYSHDWSLGDSSVAYNNYIANNLTSSNLPYVLNVEDANGCSQTAYTFVNQPPVLTVNTNEIVSSYCLNIPSGEVSVLASGGFLETGGNYNYEWNTGENSSILSNVTAGIYSVSVEDDNSCKDTLEIEVPLENSFTLSITSDSLNCYEDASGAASVFSTGGFAPYTYNWNTSSGIFVEELSNSSSNTILNLSQGVTSVVVIDGNGCTKTINTTVGQPEELLYSVFKTEDESCSGDVSSCDGEINVEAMGGTGSYTFSIFNSSNNLINSAQTNYDTTFSALCADFYNVVVQDERACLGSLSGSGETLPLQIIAGYPVDAAINLTEGAIENGISCFGDTAASLSVLNPNPSFTYDWYVNDIFTNSGVSVVLPAGDIYVRATSSELCHTNSEVATINQPSILSMAYEIQAIDCYDSANGSISVVASGGIPAYSYSWSSANNSIEGTSVLSDLSSGIYSLTLTDANECERIFDFELIQPSAIAVSSLVEDVSCNGGSDGQASIAVSGGASPYTVNWQGVDATALPSGDYPVIITDANSCTDTVEISVDEPSAITASFDSNQIPFVASASGGSPTYTYEWLFFGSLLSNESTLMPTESGDYTLVVTDANGCTGKVINVYDNNVSVSEYNDTEVLIYPNPVTEAFVIEVRSFQDESKKYTFKLIDSRGREVRNEKFKDEIKVERANLSQGIYVVLITHDGYIHHQEKIFFE